jgi:hypothetical protein
MFFTSYEISAADHIVRRDSGCYVRDQSFANGNFLAEFQDGFRRQATKEEEKWLTRREYSRGR